MSMEELVVLGCLEVTRIRMSGRDPHQFCWARWFGGILSSNLCGYLAGPANTTLELCVWHTTNSECMIVRSWWCRTQTQDVSPVAYSILSFGTLLSLVAELV